MAPPRSPGTAGLPPSPEPEPDALVPTAVARYLLARPAASEQVTRHLLLSADPDGGGLNEPWAPRWPVTLEEYHEGLYRPRSTRSRSAPYLCLELDPVVLQMSVMVVPVHPAVEGRIQGGALLDVVPAGEVMPAQLGVSVAGDDVPDLRVVRSTLTKGIYRTKCNRLFVPPPATPTGPPTG
jgi:hypothetical protein